MTNYNTPAVRRGDLALKAPSDMPPHVTKEQYEAMLELAYQRMRKGMENGEQWEMRIGMRDALLLRLMWHTGAREEDILDLRLSDFDQGRKLLALRIHKVQRVKTVTKKGEGGELLRERVRIHPDDYTRELDVPIMDDSLFVFLSTYAQRAQLAAVVDGQWEVKRDKIFDISDRQLRNIIQDYGKQIGIKVHPHMFRHGLAIHMLMMIGRDAIPFIAQRLGHRDIATTMRYYLVITPEMQRQALQGIL